MRWQGLYGFRHTWRRECAFFSFVLTQEKKASKASSRNRQSSPPRKREGSLAGSHRPPPTRRQPRGGPYCRPPFPRKSIRTGRTRPHAIRNPHLRVNAKAHLPDRIVLPPTRQQPRGGPNMARPSTSRRINYIAVRAAVPGDPYNVNLRSSLSVVGAASLGGPPTSQAPPTPGTPAPRRRNSERWRYRRSLWYPHSRTCRCCGHGASAPSRKRRSLCCRFCI